MMLVIGLFIIIPIVLIIMRLSEVKIKKGEKLFWNLTLILTIIVFIFSCFLVNKEPFKFKIYNPSEYIMYMAVIFVFTPFLWIITIYYFRKLFKSLKIKKNSIIKKDKDFIYYRETLKEVSPSIIMFTSAFDIDYKKCISSTILKLKLQGFLEEKDNLLIYTKKDDSELLESEKMILNFIKTGNLNKIQYKQTVEKETLENKYIKKNVKGILFRILMIIFIIICSVAFLKFSFWFDKYVFKNYRYYIEDDNKGYFILKNNEEIEDLYEVVEDESDYYGSMVVDIFNGGERISYYYDRIRANKLQYKVVRKAIVLNVLVPLSILLSIVGIVISAYMIIAQLIFINKNYKRTSKGTELLNKAYALKNYLKDYSLINERKEEEIVLWEYYLVYAILLNVNEEIQDEVIQKYII